MSVEVCYYYLGVGMCKFVIPGILFFLLCNNSWGGRVKLTKEVAVDYTYVADNTFITGQCSSSVFYLRPSISLPTGYSFLGSHSFNVQGQNVYPYIQGEYPSITASGRNYTSWPLNPNVHNLGLHWLCGGPYMPGGYQVALPNTIKIKRQWGTQAPSNRLTLELGLLGNYNQPIGQLGTVGYILKTSPSEEVEIEYPDSIIINNNRPRAQDTLNVYGKARVNVEITVRTDRGTELYKDKRIMNSGERMPVIGWLSNALPYGTTKGTAIVSVSII